MRIACRILAKSLEFEKKTESSKKARKHKAFSMNALCFDFLIFYEMVCVAYFPFLFILAV